AGEKRLYLAIARAAALGKNDQRHATAQAPQRRLDGANGIRRALLIDANLPRTLQMPADEWVREQFALEHNTELKRQINVEDRNVERRCVRDRVHAGFGVVELAVAQACDFHRRQDRLHDEPRPEAGYIVLNASVAVEERADERKRAQNQRVGPDQRVKNKIRTQAAKPAMAVEGMSCRPRLSPRREGPGVPVRRGFRVTGRRRLRLFSRAQFRALFFQPGSCSNLVQDSLSKLSRDQT